MMPTLEHRLANSASFANALVEERICNDTSACGTDFRMAQNRSAVQSGKHHLGVQDPATWLFLAQGYHGIYLAGPPGWDDRGSECHNS
jgi:hypothetical protein